MFPSTSFRLTSRLGPPIAAVSPLPGKLRFSRIVASRALGAQHVGQEHGVLEARQCQAGKAASTDVYGAWLNLLLSFEAFDVCVFYY